MRRKVWKGGKPEPILLSKRANAYYLEHVRVFQDGETVVFSEIASWDVGIEQLFNIPDRNTAFVLLGKGTSITDSAARMLAESGVIVGFVGSGGSPLLSCASATFLEPQSEYRPTKYMQSWARLWLDDAWRLQAAKAFFLERMDWVVQAWAASETLKSHAVSIPASTVDATRGKIEAAKDITSLMSVEAGWAKALYAGLAAGYAVRGFRRNEGAQSRKSVADLANSYIDHGNYIAYGFAAVSLYALGISFAFPVFHGKTRRGALVFDVADLYKDAIVMPHAFECASRRARDQEFRDSVIDRCLDADVIDRSIDMIKKVIGECGEESKD